MLNWDTTLCLAPVSMDSNRDNGHTHLSIFPKTKNEVSEAQRIRVFVGCMAVTEFKKNPTLKVENPRCVCVDLYIRGA
jgi:hypothetical protein